MSITRSPTRIAVAAAACVTALAAVGCGEDDAKPDVAVAAGSIVYEKEVGAVTQLYRARPDGRGERQLTHVDGNAMHPDWSPDGKQIVFHIEHKNAKPQAYCSVAVMNADGSGLVDLANRPRVRRLAVVHRGRATDRVRELRRLKDVEGVEGMDITGGDRRDVKTLWRMGVGHPMTSPDGKWITFVNVSEDGARNSLFAMRPDGSQLHRLTPPSWAIGDKYDWSPDGKLIVLTTHAHFLVPGESANVVTIRPDGTIATRITRFEGGTDNAFAGSFSSDGKQIIVRLERSATYGLATVDRDGRNLRAPSEFGTDRPRYIDWSTR